MNKSSTIILKVSPEENRLIRALAAARGLSVSSYMRSRALELAENDQVERLVNARLEAHLRTAI